MVGLITVSIFNSSIGLSMLLVINAIGCVMALAITHILGIETTGKSLEELSGEMPFVA